MRNRIPCQRDAGTRLGRRYADVPFPRATKEIGDVCTQAKNVRNLNNRQKFSFYSQKLGIFLKL